MRIISGKYRGKKLKGYDMPGTRPTMDRVKESIYGIIQGYVKDSIVLDLFAGSGSLGLEAISNGLIDKASNTPWQNGPSCSPRACLSPGGFSIYFSDCGSILSPALSYEAYHAHYN